MNILEAINKAIIEENVEEQKELIKAAPPLGLFALAQRGDIDVAAIIASQKNLDENIQVILQSRGSNWIKSILAKSQK